jgi:hypothetical protein
MGYAHIVQIFTWDTEDVQLEHNMKHDKTSSFEKCYSLHQRHATAIWLQLSMQQVPSTLTLSHAAFYRCRDVKTGASNERQHTV